MLLCAQCHCAQSQPSEQVQQSREVLFPTRARTSNALIMRSLCGYQATLILTSGRASFKPFFIQHLINLDL